MRINDILVEFAPSGDGGGSGDYFQSLASAWYNGTFDTGSLQKGIKSQQDVERLLQRGVLCPDGVTRKFGIDYNSDFDGVEIYSDDYYEHGDYDDTIDSRTGEKWGPYDHMEFSDDQLDEGVAEGNMDGKVADIKGQIAELEAEQEQNEFGSYAYDTVNGELQYLYAKLDKAEKGVAEARDGDINFGHTVTRGSWVVYDGTKVKRFKTHDGATAYAEKNGGKVASSEFYTDKIQKQGVAEGAPISGDGGAVDNFKQQMANNTELAYQKKQQGMAEGDRKSEPPEADYGDDYQDMVNRVKKLAGVGPLKTQYDPARRVYRNMPTAVQPKK